LAVRVAFAVLADLTALDALTGRADLRVFPATAFRVAGEETFFTGTGGGRRLLASLDDALTGGAFFTGGFAALWLMAFFACAAATLFGFGGAGLFDLGVTVIFPGL
jgi:hypothetical protein